MTAFTILDVGRPATVDATVVDGRVWLAAEAVHAALGWELTPEGLCGEGVCLPLPAGSALEGPHGVDLGELAAVLDRPLAVDASERAAYLGVSAGERKRTLTSLRAPDFTLPDLSGTPHTLAEQRGRKVLLVVWASW